MSPEIVTIARAALARTRDQLNHITASDDQFIGSALAIVEIPRLAAAIGDVHKRNPMSAPILHPSMADYHNTEDICVECMGDWPCLTVRSIGTALGVVES